MTLANMREQGVQQLIAFCLNDFCRHQALIDVSWVATADEDGPVNIVPRTSFILRAARWAGVCGKYVKKAQKLRTAPNLYRRAIIFARNPACIR